MPKDKLIEGLMSLAQAGRYAHVTRQCVYLAIKKGLLPATKMGKQWYITQKDFDDYRGNKYNRDLRKMDGQHVYDADKGHFSVSQISKIMAESLRIPYPVQKVYYQMRVGRLKSFRKGRAWIIDKESALELLRWEQERMGKKDISQK